MIPSPGVTALHRMASVAARDLRDTASNDLPGVLCVVTVQVTLNDQRGERQDINVVVEGSRT